MGEEENDQGTGEEQGGDAMDWASDEAGLLNNKGENEESADDSSGDQGGDHEEEGEHKDQQDDGEEQDSGDQGGDTTGSDESAEYELKYPDGFEVDAAEEQMFKDWGKDKKFSPEQMQDIVDYVTERDVRSFKSEDERQEKEAADWVAQAKADKEIGGDKFDDNLLNAKAALRKVGTPELMKVLMGTGWVNHPEFVRLFTRIAPMVLSDQVGNEDGGQGGRELTTEEKLLGSKQLADLKKGYRG